MKDFTDLIEEKIKGMTLEDKLRSMSNHGYPIDEIGIPAASLGREMAHGVEARNDQGDAHTLPVYTTVFQAPIGFASTWNPELIREIGNAVGDEARGLFNDGLFTSLNPWAPTIDMERDPRWGRTEEAYGEDPVLAANVAAAYINGLGGDESKDYIKCGATLKHFYANNTEDGRFHISSDMPDRVKFEYYLEVYRLIFKKSFPEAVMTAYNKINGIPGIANPEIEMHLRPWGVSHVVCDAMALKHSVDEHHYFNDYAEAAAGAIKAGIDCFAEPEDFTYDAVSEAFRRGLITEENLDKAIRHRLRTYARLGLLDDASPYMSRDKYDSKCVLSPEHKKLARRAEAESVVLLKNEGTLPLKEGGKVYITGPLSARNPMDWYSGLPGYTVTANDALKERAESCHVSAYPEVRIHTDKGYLKLSSEIELIDKSSNILYTSPSPRLDRECRRITFTEDIADAEIFSIMLWDDRRFTIRSKTTGRLLSVKQPDCDTLSRPMQENGFIYSIVDEEFSWFGDEDLIFCGPGGEDITFDADNALHFWEDSRISGIKTGHGTFFGYADGYLINSDQQELKINFETVNDFDPSAFDNDAPVIAVMGSHPMITCREERDRRSIELAPFQRALLREIVKNSDNVILVLSSGVPLGICEEDSEESIKAIVLTATGSCEMGSGLMDVIFGDVSPSGRLPLTWYRKDSDLTDIQDYNIIDHPKTYQYFEGEVLYPFGYGLSYTDFDISAVIDADTSGNDTVFNIRVTVRNSGDAPGSDVIEVYFKKDKEGVRRPRRRLCGFAKTPVIGPGEERIVDIKAYSDEMSFFDEESRRMEFEEGEYKFFVTDGMKEINLSLSVK